MKECILPTYEDFTGKRVAEANEFLKYLFSMFPDEDAPNLLETTYFTNDLKQKLMISMIYLLLKETLVYQKLYKRLMFTFLSHPVIFLMLVKNIFIRFS